MKRTCCARFRASLMNHVRHAAIGAAGLVTSASSAFAQSPWEDAVNRLAISFTGPIARGLTLVAIVMGGLVYAFDTGDSKRVLAGILFGGGMALGAAQFLVWLFQ